MKRAGSQIVDAAFHSVDSVYNMDPDHAIVLEITGDRLTIVSFERTLQGDYRPAGFDLLVPADRAQAEGNKSKNAGPDESTPD